MDQCRQQQRLNNANPEISFQTEEEKTNEMREIRQRQQECFNQKAAETSAKQKHKENLKRLEKIKRWEYLSGKKISGTPLGSSRDQHVESKQKLSEAEMKKQMLEARLLKFDNKK